MAAKIVKYPTRSRKELTRKLSLLFFIACIMVSLYLFLGQTISYLQVKKDLKNLKSAVESMEAENERLRRNYSFAGQGYWRFKPASTWVWFVREK